jgi:teichuronic acid biosynthesis glycosyltransferase TuaG
MISILVPIYNGIEYIDDSIQSIINQTYTEWELFIGVNGHKPNSEVYRIAKKYEEKYPSKICVLDLYVCGGKPNTLNEMIKYCKYNYIALLDVDDIWFPKKLEIQLKYIVKYDVVGTDCVYFGDIEGKRPGIPLGDITEFDFKKKNPVINSSCIIKKIYANWKDIELEDYDLWLELKKNKCKFYNCEEVLVRHRIHMNSAFNSKGNNNHIAGLIEKYSSLN